MSETFFFLYESRLYAHWKVLWDIHTHTAEKMRNTDTHTHTLIHTHTHWYTHTHIDTHTHTLIHTHTHCTGETNVFECESLEWARSWFDMSLFEKSPVCAGSFAKRDLRIEGVCESALRVSMHVEKYCYSPFPKKMRLEMVIPIKLESWIAITGLFSNGSFEQKRWQVRVSIRGCIWAFVWSS